VVISTYCIGTCRFNHDITEILLKVALKTITLTYLEELVDYSYLFIHCVYLPR